MTKEELAKKRGIKINKATQTPSEALLTSKKEAPAATESKSKTEEKSKENKKTTNKQDNQKLRATSSGSKDKEKPKEVIKKEQRIEEKEKEKEKKQEPKAETPIQEVAGTDEKQKEKDPEQTIKTESPKNKGGRPRTRTEQVKIANIAIPVSVYNDMVNMALPVYNGNLTEYVNYLIKKDIETNISTYRLVSDAMKRAKEGI